MTFALFLLFKYRLGKVIWAYMGFSGFLIFGILGGNICMQVLQKLDVAVDMVTVSVALWNFTVGGVLLTLFLARAVVGQAGVFNQRVGDRVVLFFKHSRVDDVVDARSDGAVRFIRRAHAQRTVAVDGGVGARSGTKPFPRLCTNREEPARTVDDEDTRA